MPVHTWFIAGGPHPWTGTVDAAWWVEGRAITNSPPAAVGLPGTVGHMTGGPCPASSAVTLMFLAVALSVVAAFHI